MLIDVHAHLNFHAYNNDRQEVIDRCQNMKVINIGSQFPTSRLALELASKNKNMFASVGLHPVHVGGQEHDENEMSEKVSMTDEEQFLKIRELLESDTGNQIVAVGETGLDYYRLVTGLPRARSRGHSSLVTRETQKKMLIKHIELAQEFNKPLMLHCRGNKDNPEEAYNDILKILMTNDSSLISNTPGMIHCFSSTIDIAQKFISLGFYVGFTGIITFPNAGDLINVVREIPLNRILTETDSPYLSPQAVRGQRNEPKNVEYVIQKIAEIKNISYDEVQSAVEKNANNLFKI